MYKNKHRLRIYYYNNEACTYMHICLLVLRNLSKILLELNSLNCDLRLTVLSVKVQVKSLLYVPIIFISKIKIFSSCDSHNSNFL